MSQMNKGVPNPKAGSGQPFKPGLSPQGKAKAEIANQQGKIQRGQAQLQRGGPDNALMGHMNVESGKSGVIKGQAALAAAKTAKPTGPTMGARTGKGSEPTQLGAAKMTVQTAKLGPQELGAAKLKPQSTSLGAKQLGAAKLTPFKAAGPSNPMGRMGGKPGVNIGTNKK
ncbi:MAG: hypothetical protein WC718_08790 [Phycisphaerales bacterium]|jgi:hypothetical protein